MTLKEQIMKLQTYKMHEGEDTVYVERDDVLKALEQEPCEDCISRQAAIDAILKIHPVDTEYDCTLYDKVDVMYVLKDLSPVNPQEPKIGHWIENAEEYYKAINEKGGGVNDNTPYFDDDIACSECLAKFSIVENEVERFDYCPNCGAKMIESQESEDKE